MILESLVSCAQICAVGLAVVPLGKVRRFPSNGRIKEVYPEKRYFSTIGSSSVRTVADRHRLAAHHNKHC